MNSMTGKKTSNGSGDEKFESSRGFESYVKP